MANVESAYNPGLWSTFFAAEAGASAALTGLIFVAVSINLSKIIALRLLIARSAKALFTLIGVLVASTFCMVPDQSEISLGLELTATGILVWLTTSLSQQRASHDNPFITRRQRVFHFALTQCAALPFVAGGISIMMRAGGGLYWLVAGTILSFLAALLDAWVLLIEIQR